MRHRGFLWALAGISVISPDALLLRLALKAGVNDPSWSPAIALVKFTISTFFSLSWGIYVRGGLRALVGGTCTNAPLVALGVFFNAGIMTGFTMSLMLTGAAEACLIVALNPLLAAILGWWFLSDALPVRTVVALICAMGATSIIFVPRFVGSVHTSVAYALTPARRAAHALDPLVRHTEASSHAEHRALARLRARTAQGAGRRFVCAAHVHLLYRHRASNPVLLMRR
jgi:drug/metabolite transporter (DMT)-like permease